MSVPWRVLVVDDEPDVLASLQDLVASVRGVSVDTASSLASAMALVRAHDYHIVIADHRLTDGTGVELLAWVGHRSPSSSLVLVSAYQDFDMLLEAVNKAHIHQFVSKPWDPEEIVRVVQRLVEQHRALETGMRAFVRAADAGAEPARTVANAPAGLPPA